MATNTYVILNIPPNIQEQKAIGGRINQVPGVRYTGGSTEGLITVEMDRCHIPAVKKALGPEFEKCTIITYRMHQEHLLSSRRRSENRL